MTSIGKTVTLGELFAGTGCKLNAKEAAVQVSGLANDSRKVKRGDLFFAIPGFSADGRKYVPEAISLGARAVVSQSNDLGSMDIPVIYCKNIRRVLSQIAARYYDNPSLHIPVVGVTGTNGKTTTTYYLTHIMSSVGKQWGRIGTVEYFTGKRTENAINTTPDSLLLQELLAEILENKLSGCAMEVSSHGLDMGRCDDISFTGAIFTNLTQDHLDYHKTMDRYFSVKSILFEKLVKQDGFCVLNADDPYSEKMKKVCRAKVLSYSLSNTSGADFIVEDRGIDGKTGSFRLHYKGRTFDGTLPHLGRFNLYNFVAALAAATALNVEIEPAVEAMRHAPQVPGRVQIIDMGQPFTVIVDYAHTPDALKNLLTSLECPGEKLVVFGCGGDRDKAKRPLMGEIAVSHADRVIVTSDNPRSEEPGKIIKDILKGMSGRKNYTVVENRDEAIGRAVSSAKSGDLVIIAGKGHEDYQIIGRNKHYFSDQDVARRYLKKLGYADS